MQKRYSTCFTIKVTVKTIIEANSIRELRAKIRDELREPDSYLALPSSLVYNSAKLKINSNPHYKHHYPTDDDFMIERALKVETRLNSDPRYFENEESDEKSLIDVEKTEVLVSQL
jgi:hypothetical protein